MNRGIMTVHRMYDEAVVRRMLPPEHSVVAIRQLDDVEEWLIEGAHMPVAVRPEDPERVILRIGRHDCFAATGSWAHNPLEQWDVSFDLILEVLATSMTAHGDAREKKALARG
jgi:hypothetical protein